jgi:hypothetical protein
MTAFSYCVLIYRTKICKYVTSVATQTISSVQITSKIHVQLNLYFIHYIKKGKFLLCVFLCVSHLTTPHSSMFTSHSVHVSDSNPTGDLVFNINLAQFKSNMRICLEQHKSSCRMMSNSKVYNQIDHCINLQATSFSSDPITNYTFRCNTKIFTSQTKKYFNYDGWNLFLTSTYNVILHPF